MSLRTEQVAAEIVTRHCPKPQVAPSPRQDTTETAKLSAEWSLRLDASSSPLLENALRSFRQNLAHSWNLQLGLTQEDRPQQVVFRSAATSNSHFDRQDPAVESFTLKVSPSLILVEASHERGLLQATHYLERTFIDNGETALPLGQSAHTPAFMPRLSNGVFIPNNQSPLSPGEFSDEYLSLMSHFGNNGIHLYINLYAVCKNDVLVELNSTDFERQIEALNAHNRRLLDHGIDLYLHVNTPPLPADHPVFLSHPEVRGSRVEIFMDHVSGKEWYNLCSHSQKTLDFYRDAFQQLFSAAPDLAGAMIIVGGECFFHCYTRPLLVDDHRTNCPHCKDLEPDREIAQLVNTLASAVKSTGKHKALYAWPYSAFVWSGQDDAQLGWIQHLSPDVSVLSNYDCGVPDTTGGDRAWLFDYNIKLTDQPSSVFARQQDALASLQRPIFTKTETNTTPDAFSLPYLPLHYRWLERFRGMQQRGVAGYVGQWRFYGMNASPPEEWLYRMTWSADESSNDILSRWALQLGIAPSDTNSALQAWQHISDAWEDYPYSAMTSGERQAYMRGPMYIGPAQPLIFDVQDHYELDLRFWLPRGDAGEMPSPQESDNIRQSRKPRYISDLLTVVPFGVQLYLEKLEACIQRYQRGADLLRSVLPSVPNKSAQLEIDVVDALLIQLKTLRNTVHFYQTRDALYRQEASPQDFDRYITDLSNILREEIANAESALPILQRQPSIGYGHCYTEAYDYDLVADKIRQCTYVLNKELPRFSAVVRFHLWLDFSK